MSRTYAHSVGDPYCYCKHYGTTDYLLWGSMYLNFISVSGSNAKNCSTKARVARSSSVLIIHPLWRETRTFPPRKLCLWHQKRTRILQQQVSTGYSEHPFRIIGRYTSHINQYQSSYIQGKESEGLHLPRLFAPLLWPVNNSRACHSNQPVDGISSIGRVSCMPWENNVCWLDWCSAKHPRYWLIWRNEARWDWTQ